MHTDTSDYISRLRLFTQQKANSAADSTKFRAPTRDTVYDPNRVVKNSIGLDDFKNPTIQHSTIAAQKLSATPSKTTG